MDITMWQYASEGWVDGISTPVDMNLDLSQALE
jgi:GH25 family lysozyme M1 (1,4-beta-N-acetylmuramidase)